ncbi:hypothetical protein V8D89_010446 [Ganoderma adspersum]
MAATDPGRSACEVTPFLAPPRCYRNLGGYLDTLPTGYKPMATVLHTPSSTPRPPQPTYHTTEPPGPTTILPIPLANSFYAARRRVPHSRTHRSLDPGAGLSQGAPSPIQRPSSIPNWVVHQDIFYLSLDHIIVGGNVLAAAVQQPHIHAALITSSSPECSRPKHTNASARSEHVYPTASARIPHTAVKSAVPCEPAWLRVSSGDGGGGATPSRS